MAHRKIYNKIDIFLIIEVSKNWLTKKSNKNKEIGIFFGEKWKVEANFAPTFHFFNSFSPLSTFLFIISRFFQRISALRGFRARNNYKDTDIGLFKIYYFLMP